MKPLPLKPWPMLAVVVAIGIAATAVIGLSPSGVRAADAEKKKPVNAASASLTVAVTQAQRVTLPLRIAANGSIAAWQEASIGTEAHGLRLSDVQANVGDVVKRGQVLATFSPDTVQADIAQSRASVAEAQAMLAAASADAQRARELQPTGALSEQQINQYLTAERTARSRLEAQQALAQTQKLRLQQTQVLAPDDGVISSRSATVGAVLPAGQELFRLIRKGRLEWRAEVPATDLAKLAAGMSVSIVPTGGTPLNGTVRMVAPTVDPTTRNGLVYVDLVGTAAQGAARAGMFARGEFRIGSDDTLTLPQSAVLLREGFSYVLQVAGDHKVKQVKVTVGRHVADRIEILAGLDPAARVVASGGVFLADGDTVRVATAAAASAAK